MRIHLCGVRGSTPAPGREFVRYGGHTSCVAVAHDGERPSLLLDAGTGIRRVWELTGGLPFRGAILLGHLHWDHTQGLPFSRAGDHPDARVDLHVPAQEGRTALDLLSQGMSRRRSHRSRRPPRRLAFPHPRRGRGGDRGVPVVVRDIPHKGGRALGFRISDGRSTVAYLSDHRPVSLGPGPAGHGPYHETARELCDGVAVPVTVAAEGAVIDLGRGSSPRRRDPTAAVPDGTAAARVT